MTICLRIQLLLACLLMMVACTDRKEMPSDAVVFTARHFTIKNDTAVGAVAWLNNKIICLQRNDKLMVLDTGYNRLPDMERLLENYQVEYLFTRGDSVFLIVKGGVYYLDSSLALKPHKKPGGEYSNVLYEDSVYTVYSCCVGEFGGSVFFRNRKTNRTYSYYATCVSEVVKFNNQYVVCSNLPRMYLHQDFLFISDPEKLFELTAEKQKYYCNWFMEVDSLKSYGHRKHRAGVRWYDTYNAVAMATFQKGDSLYSLVCGDTSTYMAVHRGDTLVSRQILFEKAIRFHESESMQAGGRVICRYSLMGDSLFAAQPFSGNRTGVLVVNGTNLDFLSFTQK